MNSQRIGQEVPPSEAKRHKVVEPQTNPETDVQLNLDFENGDLTADQLAIFA